MLKKGVVFLTGTRADFGKQKSLIKILEASKEFDVHIFATGMHMNQRYGTTVNEIIRYGFKNIYKFINQNDQDRMDNVLAKTIEGFSDYVNMKKPDLIIVHGDRVEALAGAVVGALNNILVAHVEGGEISGTVDELIRHSVSKMSHIHFVSNKLARMRLIQMGEDKGSIFIIGSPDIDIMRNSNLPSLKEVKKYYGINFESYAIVSFHPVTTEFSQIDFQSQNLVKAIMKSNCDYVVIYPNNDYGSDFILNAYRGFAGNNKMKIFESLRFEYFLVLLRNAKFIIGNSSAGIREAPYFGIPTINIGTRQNGRALSKEIINCGYEEDKILQAIKQAGDAKIKKTRHFGQGRSDKLFFKLLNSQKIWEINKQKIFKDLGSG